MGPTDALKLAQETVAGFENDRTVARVMTDLNPRLSYAEALADLNLVRAAENLAARSETSQGGING